MKKNKKLNPWISTVSIDSICYAEDSMEQRLRRIDDYIAAITDQPDLILLPEACLTGLASLEERYRFISPQDKYFSHFQQLAKQYNTHIAARPFHQLPSPPKIAYNNNQIIINLGLNERIAFACSA